MSDPTALAGGTSEAMTRDARISRAIRLLATGRNVLLLLVLLVIFAVFSVASPTFSSGFNIYSAIQLGVTIGLLAIGETIVILSGGGGIDLSVGSMLSVAGMTIGVLNILNGVNIWVSVAAAVLIGVLMGAINGFLVSVVRIPPLIATLATYFGYAALALQPTNTKPLPDATQPNLPQSFDQAFQNIGNGNVQDVPWLSWVPKIGGQFIPFQVLFVYIPVVLIAAFVLRRMVAGRYIYGVGTNAMAARFAAINVWGVRFWAYVASGLLAGIAAVVQTAVSASATPDAGNLLNLQAITIVVLGGVSVLGGEGNILGVVLASLIVIFLYNGLGVVGGSDAAIWQPFALGVLLIGSVLFNEWLRRRVSVA